MINALRRAVGKLIQWLVRSRLDSPKAPQRKPGASQRKSRVELVCEYSKCKEKFKPKKHDHKYHSGKCRSRDWDEKNPRVKTNL